ncbi:nuclear transport factor 2 family protein [Streptomyces djakartensis]|jgi:actinorhodin biosynthesis protein ActVIA|uniref:nuclear transport factor 2 family protein n=1 Tax=Streptomyces djakartensis TaxID=68193 RepID=UPI0034E016D0
MTTDTLIRPQHAPAQAGFGELYGQVLQFYAHQMQLFDGHEAERWAATFTEDGVFDVPTLDAPLRGRAGLAANVRRSRAVQERGGDRLRHFVGMLDIQPGRADELHTRCYALVYGTAPGGSCRVVRVCVMQDVLVRVRGKWRTRHRVVTRDDLV